MAGVIVSYDGTKYCIHILDDCGKIITRKCCQEAKEVRVEAPCFVEGYAERPGFVMKCEGEARCEGSLVVVST